MSPAMRVRIAVMVYQQFINYPSTTRTSPAMRFVGQVRRSALRKAADLMQLTAILNRCKPLELSGGQQQRCALARALVKDAGLVSGRTTGEPSLQTYTNFEEAGSIFVYATTEPEEALSGRAHRPKAHHAARWFTATVVHDRASSLTRR
ncbi:ATP-binding cassette domain-containing protein [Sulfitobacter pontiacus]